MRLSKYATTPVSPTDSWKAVALTIVLVSGIGFYTAYTRRLPNTDLWLWGGGLLLIWSVAAFQAFRFGRRAFPWHRVAVMAGYTLFGGENLLPHPLVMVVWLSNIGGLIMMVGILSPLIEFGRRRGAASIGISDDLAK